MQYMTDFKKVSWGKWGHVNLDCVLDDSNVPGLNLLVSVIIVWISLFLEGTC